MALTLVALARDFLLPPSVNARSLEIKLFKLWPVKDSMCKSRLLLNDMPVFRENLFKIRPES